MEVSSYKSDMLQQKREADRAAADFKDVNENLVAENNSLRNKLQESVRYALTCFDRMFAR